MMRPAREAVKERAGTKQAELMASTGCNRLHPAQATAVRSGLSQKIRRGEKPTRAAGAEEHAADDTGLSSLVPQSLDYGIGIQVEKRSIA